MRKKLFLVLLKWLPAALLLPAAAQKTFITNQYSTDPSVRVFGDLFTPQLESIKGVKGIDSNVFIDGVGRRTVGSSPAKRSGSGSHRLDTVYHPYPLIWQELSNSPACTWHTDNAIKKQ